MTLLIIASVVSVILVLQLIGHFVCGDRNVWRYTFQNFARIFLLVIADVSHIFFSVLYYMLHRFQNLCLASMFDVVVYTVVDSIGLFFIFQQLRSVFIFVCKSRSFVKNLKNPRCRRNVCMCKVAPDNSTCLSARKKCSLKL